MLDAKSDYEALYKEFSWQVPKQVNIADLACEQWAKSEPDRPAILTWNGPRDIASTTYGELSKASSGLANAMSGLGIQSGNRVAILLPQCTQTAIAHLAIYKLGAIAVPLALLFGVEGLEYRLVAAGVSMIITNSIGLQKLRNIEAPLPELHHIICIDGADGDAYGFDQLISENQSHFATADTLADTPALMVFTSGTTGPPKGALHAHRVLLGHYPGVQMGHDFLPQPGDRMWTPADWAWAGGLLNILLPGLALGVPVVCSPSTKFIPEEVCQLMGDAKVRNTFIPPTALKMLKKVEHPVEEFGVNLRTVFSGGEALGRETYEWGKSVLGLSINEIYGQTECNLVLASCGEIGVVKPGSTGKPVPGHQVAVVDDEGKPCAIDETGQIAVKRPDPVMFLEYWQNPQATKDKFMGDWMLTGDQAIRDAEGYYHFVGRDDDIITSAGFRIGPGEIEDCLIGHPAVSLAAAVGKPDELRTEIVKAYIVLNAGYQPSQGLEDEIRQHVRQRLSAHEYPREIDFVEEMPLTTTGKVIRRLFREKAARESEVTD